MKTRYWILICLLMGVLIACFGKNCFLLLLAITWGGGGILYFLHFSYKQVIWMQKNKLSAITERKSRYDTLKLYRKRMEAYEDWARIFMYLGCVAIVEALIII